MSCFSRIIFLGMPTTQHLELNIEVNGKGLWGHSSILLEAGTDKDAFLDLDLSY